MSGHLLRVDLLLGNAFEPDLDWQQYHRKGLMAHRDTDGNRKHYQVAEALFRPRTGRGRGLRCSIDTPHRRGNAAPHSP